jgi:hypothetical protein
MQRNAVVSKDPPLTVQVPNASQDKPAWVKVGVIAAVGFVVGIAWPRVIGVRLGPSAPGEAAAAAAAAAGSGSAHPGGRAPESPVASGGASPSSSSKTPAIASTTASTPSATQSSVAANAVPPNITVPKGLVISCKTSDGDTKKGNKDCGAVPGVDALVMPRVRKISTCSGVEGQTGKLSLIVNADFASGRFWYEVGKSSTLQNMDAITSCLKTSFHGVSTTATPHEHPRYTVAYTAVFAPGEDEAKAHANKDNKPEAKAKDAPPSDQNEKTTETSPVQPASANAQNSGEATVAWEVALVRDAPKTGGLVSRLPRGTKVKVGSSKDGWYQIKFGESFNNDGWVYRGAIGR